MLERQVIKNETRESLVTLVALLTNREAIAIVRCSYRGGRLVIKLIGFYNARFLMCNLFFQHLDAVRIIYGSESSEEIGYYVLGKICNKN